MSVHMLARRLLLGGLLTYGARGVHGEARAAEEVAQRAGGEDGCDALQVLHVAQ
jgi:hypothetical protein